MADSDSYAESRRRAGLPDDRFLDGGNNGPRESAWERNRAIIRKRWPRVFKRLNTATIEGCQLTVGTPAQGLVYRGRQMTSAFDLIDEAKRQASRLDLNAEYVNCYGIGLGHLPMLLVEHYKKVDVVIMNLTIARAAFEAYEQRWLSAQHVTLGLAEDVDILYTPYACVPMECRYADEQGHAMRDRLFAHLNARFVDDFHFKANIPQDQAHVDENAVHVRADRRVTTLFGTQQGRRVVLVGGGPSLMGEIEWLRSAQAQGALVIATSTVLKLLLGHQIRPDFTVVSDTDPANIVQLDGVDLETTRSLSLVYHPTVTPKIISAWRGPRYFYNDPAELYTSGTVMHMAADLAVKMGAAEVVMLGMDFCYPGAKSHADGTADYHEIEQRPTLLETTDGNGQRAYTDPNLAQYHRHLEDYIAQKSGVRWFKRGRSGVSVRGAEWA